MCVCVPAAWPYLLLVLLFGSAAVAGLLNAIATAIVAAVGGAVVIAITARVIDNLLWDASIRRHNERMADRYPHLRAQLPARRRVNVSLVPPKALEAARPQLPPSVRVYATPQKELQR